MSAAKSKNGKPDQPEITTTPEASVEELAAKRNSARFLQEVEKQFVAELGSSVAFTPLEKRLAQHMYLAVNQALVTAESKRDGKGTEYGWQNVDRQQLALDTVHRISMGLDALIPNHIWPIFYWNSAKRLYTADLRIGYVGRDYVAREHALVPPIDIIYELVYDTDVFRALPRGLNRDVDTYQFDITSPFNRGEIIGGFGYVIYDDPRRNKLVLVTQEQFERSENAAGSKKFWTADRVAMHLKTVVHRTAATIRLDPKKVNASAYAALLADDRDPLDVAHRNVAIEAEQQGNRKTIDVALPAKATAPEPPQEPADDAAQEAPGGLFDAQEAAGDAAPW